MSKKHKIRTKLIPYYGKIVMLQGIYKKDDENAKFRPMFMRIKNVETNEPVCYEMHINKSDIVRFVNCDKLEEDKLYGLVGVVTSYKYKHSDKINYTIKDIRIFLLD